MKTAERFAHLLVASALLFSASAVRAEESRFEAARRYMMANVSPVDGAKGSVIASPSRANPDYYYHWVRDGALVMDVVRRLADSTPKDHDRYTQIVWDYADFSRENQMTQNRSGSPLGSGLGEPKFYVDGSAYNLDWGRPQSDGPALRALTLIRFARTLLALPNGRQQVESKLYRIALPADTVIKADLEYISHRWRDASYDLWEEFYAEHFYTRLVQRRAMIEGADLADTMGDHDAANWYRMQVVAISGDLDQYFDTGANYIRTMRNWKGGTPDARKTDGLDTGVILAVLHAQGNDDFFSIDDERVLATANTLEMGFTPIYKINGTAKDSAGHPMAPAIGRYMHDQYDGNSVSGQGNPWFLATNAFAELHYRLATLLENKGQLKITAINSAFFKRALETTGHSTDFVNNLGMGTLSDKDARFTETILALRQRGDQFLARTDFHAGNNGAMSEQINRETGNMQGANDLTWSYASYLTATWAK